MELLKVEPGADHDTLLDAIMDRLGFRPEAVFVGDSRVRGASDLEDGDKVRCERSSSSKRPREETDASAADGKAGAGTLQITIKTADNNEMTFKLKPTTKLSKMLDAFAANKGVPPGSACPYRFHFDGQRVNPSMTPADLEMEDGDLVDASLQQEGGT